jgi:hypothetical protein
MHERHAQHGCALFITFVVLVGSLFFVMACAAGPSGAAISRAAATRLADPPNATHGHQDSHTPKHKEGPVAVAVSVLGIIAVVAGVAFLASMSARRRMGGKPFGKGQRGPPGDWRSFFR